MERTFIITEENLYELAELIVDKIKPSTTNPEEQFITKDELKQILNLKSNTSIQRIRDEHLIEFTQIGKRKYLYRLSSVLKYLNNNIVKY